LTKLEILYSINKTLLDSRNRQMNGWFESQDGVDDFVRFRPEDLVLEEIYKELAVYWDSILSTLPVLKAEAPKMRNHEVMSTEDPGDEQDHMLFWPMGQLILAEVIRHLLDQADVAAGDRGSTEKALAALTKITWNLDEAPWKHFFVVPNESGKWIINANRTNVMRLAVSILITACSASTDDDEAWDNLKSSWKNLLVGVAAEGDYEVTIDEMWQQGRTNLGG
jgi:hypothetical protein